MKTLRTFLLFITCLIMCSCQPKMSLQEMSTRDLYQISMKHPAKAGIFAFNDPCATGICDFKDHCPEFRELWNRSDFAVFLLDEYSKYDVLAIDPDWEILQVGEYTFTILYIEFFLAQQNIMNQLDTYGVRILKEMAVSNYQKKKTLPEVYGMGLWSTAAVCTRILIKEKPELFDDWRLFEARRFTCGQAFEDEMKFGDEMVELLTTIEL